MEGGAITGEEKSDSEFGGLESEESSMSTTLALDLSLSTVVTSFCSWDISAFSCLIGGDSLAAGFFAFSNATSPCPHPNRRFGALGLFVSVLPDDNGELEEDNEAELGGDVVVSDGVNTDAELVAEVTLPFPSEIVFDVPSAAGLLVVLGASWEFPAVTMEAGSDPLLAMCTSVVAAVAVAAAAVIAVFAIFVELDVCTVTFEGVLFFAVSVEAGAGSFEGRSLS